MKRKAWKSCCNGASQPQHIQLQAPCRSASETQHPESLPLSPARKAVLSPKIWFIPCRCLSVGCRRNQSSCAPDLSSSDRFLKLGGINPDLSAYHRHPFSARLIAEVCIPSWDDTRWRRICVWNCLPLFILPARIKGLKITLKYTLF